MEFAKAAVRSAVVVVAALASSGAHAAKPGPTEAALPSGSVAPPTPTFVWTKAAEATQYQVQGYDQQDKKVFGGMVPAADANCTTQSFCRIAAPKAFPFGPSKWRVRAGNGEGWGPWSAWAEFWVGGPATAQSQVVPFHNIIRGEQTVISLTIEVPDRGAVSVASHGYMRCLRGRTRGGIDVSTVVTDDPGDDATGAARPGFLAIDQIMDVGQISTFNQSTTRVFQVDEPGTKTFYWRSNGYSYDTNDDLCTIISATLTAEYFPYQIGPVEPPPAGGRATTGRPTTGRGPGGSAGSRP